ncbi:hydantoinase B/oxoprolinase family protein [Acetobacteraceae bacterium KSS8]|uniref:Hydantoinase B/oxoprolinase family protein n=1 Tax=Endosaccharibacter trunci TaxID=2812733 RepID=A0ABT1W849_9PROT|nr:hydantoinase B/oxoprolinase family protein [Acetobacteraceae bacterium KSS8]
MRRHDPVTHLAGVPGTGQSHTVDPITTEVVRHALNSAANQMKRALIRTAFSPIIYEVLDFAVAIYDAELRMLSQAPSLPIFMGTLNFAVREAVRNIGGPAALSDGDILMYNWPYGSGSHPQDMVIIAPVFFEGELIGYAVIKGHWLDIAAKDPYCTDTTDVFQEGTVFPGVRIYRKGKLNEDIHRMVVANSRVPQAVCGDLEAQVTGCRVGARSLIDVVRRFGLDVYRAAVERIFDHGETIIRSFFEKLPDGRYVGSGAMDNDGIGDAQIPFEIAVEIKGSDVVIDFSEVPDAQGGPVNSPLPSTIAASRVAISMLAGYGEAPHEGHFRPIKVITRPGSMFDPLPPAPCFLYGWPALQAIEVIYNAIADALPGGVPACSGGCICAVVLWGTREATGEAWADGAPHPAGQGAWASGDGGTMLHIAESATRFTPAEVWEARNPFVVSRLALAQDSGGAGRHRGGPGLDLFIRMTEDTFITTVFERSKTPGWGLEGGQTGRANNAVVVMPDGTEHTVPKITHFLVPKGGELRMHTGGGGGYGDPSERTVEDVRNDLADGYISADFAMKAYPHAV